MQICRFAIGDFAAGDGYQEGERDVGRHLVLDGLGGAVGEGDGGVDEETANQEQCQLAVAPEEYQRAQKCGQEEHRVELEAQKRGKEHQPVAEIEGEHVAAKTASQDVFEKAGQRGQVGCATQGQVDEHE